MTKTKYIKNLKKLKNTIKNNRISNGNKSKKKSKTFKNKKIKKTNLLRGGTPNPFGPLHVTNNDTENTLSSTHTKITNPNPNTTIHISTPTNSNLTGFIHNLSLTLKEARNSFLQ